MKIRDQSFVLVSEGGRGGRKYRSLNAKVAQFKNYPFRVNITIPPKIITTSDNKGSGIYRGIFQRKKCAGIVGYSCYIVGRDISVGIATC